MEKFTYRVSRMASGVITDSYIIESDSRLSALNLSSLLKRSFSGVEMNNKPIYYFLDSYDNGYMVEQL